jgi:stage II sporulation protein M
MISIQAVQRREQFVYLRRLVPYLLASAILIGAGTVLGFLSPIHAPKIADEVSAPVAEFAGKFAGLPKPYLALAIFLNNTLKTLLVIVLGTLWGLVPVLFLIVNGYAIGVVLYISVQSQGTLASVVAIVPHGVFEIPALLLATSIGLMIGMDSLKRLFGNGGSGTIAEIKLGLKFFVAVIIPLLFIAALVEAFVTAAGVAL